MPVSLGLELGDGVVRAVVLERQGKQLRLRTALEQAWTGEDTPEGLRGALTQIRKELRVTAPAVIGLPTHLAVVATVEPLLVTRAKAPLAVAFELQQHLPYPASDAVWEYQWWANGGRRAARSGTPVADPASGGVPGSVAPQTHAVVAAVRRSVLDERVQACRQAGFFVQGVSIGALAAVNAWWRGRRPAASSTPVADHASGMVPGSVAQTAPPGEDDVLVLLDGTALEWLRIRADGVRVFATALSDPSQAAGVLSASLEADGDATAAGRPARVWLFGRSADEGAAAAMRRELGCEAAILDPVQLLSLGEAVLPQAPAWLPALGLALQGLGEAKVPMNLLTGIEAVRAARGTRRTLRALGAAASLAAVVTALTGMWTVAARLQRDLAAVTAQERLYKSLRPEVRSALQRHTLVSGRLAQLDTVVRGHLQLGTLFSQMVSFLPEEAWFKKVELTGLDTVNGVVEGRANSFQSVTQFMDQLRAAGGWTTIKPLATAVTTDAATGQESVAFSLQLQKAAPSAGSAGSAVDDESTETAPRAAKRKPGQARGPVVRTRKPPAKTEASDE